MSATTWRWLTETAVLAIHDAQIAEHGGAAGVRDLALVQSALARPQNLAAYGAPDIADLAAAYASGIVRNHGFVDGNKRTGLVVAELFLSLNRWELTATDAECVIMTLSLAAGEIDEAEIARWIRGAIVTRE